MNSFVVWLDSKNAHVFSLKTTGIEKIKVAKNNKDHQRRHKNDMRRDSKSERYYLELSDQLKGADQVLLMGPGLAKNHFKDYLTTHLANTIAKKIIGLERMESFEHKSEKQMMAKAHEFFKTYDLFNNPI